MGCKVCTNHPSSEKLLIKELLSSIHTESTSALTHSLSKLSNHTKRPKNSLLNERLISFSTFHLNLLSYCIISGSSKCFKFLFQSCGASIPLMLENFSLYNLDPLLVLCEKNHFDLLKYFLPLYFQYRSNSCTSVKTCDLFKTPELKEPKSTFTPIQVACLFGNITIVDYLFSYNLKFADPMIDVNEVNEETGENCALIGVRSGSLAMVKGLFEKFGADFRVCNKFGENALAVCAACSSKNSEETSFQEIFVYLVEEVGVDPSENYEEVLLLLDDKVMIDYFQEVLAAKGIKAEKREIELKNRVHGENRARVENLKSMTESFSALSAIQYFSQEHSETEEIFLA